jgi:hypothetical protein
MLNLFLLGAVAVMVLSGTVIMMPAARWKVKLEKYEFEHRTSGGVVQFPRYEDSVAHESKKKLANMAMNFGGTICAFAIFTAIICIGMKLF